MNMRAAWLKCFQGSFGISALWHLTRTTFALTKLDRNIERDRSDVRYLARTIPFDLDLLQERYRTELRPYLTNPDRADLSLQLWIGGNS
jgi:hypothetical protein